MAFADAYPVGLFVAQVEAQLLDALLVEVDIAELLKVQCEFEGGLECHCEDWTENALI